MLKSIDALGIDSEAIKEKVMEINKQYEQQYNLSAASWLLKKWKITDENR